MNRRSCGLALVMAVVVSLVAVAAEAQGRNRAFDPGIAAAIARGDSVIPWDGRGVVPPGYEATTHGNRVMIWAGFGTAALGWVSLTSYGLATTMSCGLIGGDNCEDDVTFLVLPVAGPWLALGTGETVGLSPFILVASGLAQAGGVALSILGATQRQPVLLRRREVTVVPILAPGVQGVGVQSRF